MRRNRATWLIPPPAEQITPAVARRWLHRTYPGLARLGSLGAYPIFLLRGAGLRRAEKEAVQEMMRSLSGDVRRIAEACGAAIDTGRPIRMQFRRWGDVRWIVRRLRLLLRFEEYAPHRGARGPLRQALRVHELALRRAGGRKRAA